MEVKGYFVLVQASNIASQKIYLAKGIATLFKAHETLCQYHTTKITVTFVISRFDIV